MTEQKPKVKSFKKDFLLITEQNKIPLQPQENDHGK